MCRLQTLALGLKVGIALDEKYETSNMKQNWARTIEIEMDITLGKTHNLSKIGNFVGLSLGFGF